MDTIADTLTYFLGTVLPACVNQLSHMYIVSGVSLLSFIVGMILLIVVTGAIVYRA